MATGASVEIVEGPTTRGNNGKESDYTDIILMRPGRHPFNLYFPVRPSLALLFAKEYSIGFHAVHFEIN